MKKIQTLILLLLFLSSTSKAQQVTYEIQTGLSGQIRKMIALGNEQEVLVAEEGGNMVVWNISQNKILARMNTGLEIYDAAYLKDITCVAVATPGAVLFYAYSNGALQLIHRFESDNPTALCMDGEYLWLASNQEISKLKVRVDGISVEGKIYTQENAASSLKIDGKKIYLLNFSGLSVYSLEDLDVFPSEDDDFSKDIQMDPPDTSSYNPNLTEIRNDPVKKFKFTNTGWYGNAWDEVNKRVFISNENRLIIVEYEKASAGIQSVVLPVQSHEYITGIATRGDRLFAGTRNGDLFQARINNSTSQIVFEEPFRLITGSVTFILPVSKLLMVGDFFGNAYILDPVNKTLILDLDDNDTPPITSVHFGARDRMVTTHKGPQGSMIRIWNSAKASLEFTTLLKAQQVASLEIGNDTITTFHVDGAIFRILKQGDLYDTACIRPPLVPFDPAFAMSRPEAEPMFVIQQFRDEIRNASAMPALQYWTDSVNRVHFFLSPAKKAMTCDNMPDYNTVQSYIRLAGLHPYLENWDVMDVDLFFMKACRYDKDRFAEYIKSTPVPPEKGMAFYNFLRKEQAARFYVTDLDRRDTLFQLPMKELEYFTYDPGRKQFIVFYDSSIALFDMRTRNLSVMNVEIPASFFHFAVDSGRIAIASPGKLRLYTFNKEVRSTTWLSFGTDNYLIHNDNGYYKTRGRSDRLVAFENGKELPFEYFDLKYNRPDILLKGLGGQVAEEAKIYEIAVNKRIRRMENKIPFYRLNSIPGIHYTIPELPLYTDQNEMILDLKAGNKHRTAVWVNGVKEQTSYTSKYPLQLSYGLNKINWHLQNEAGDTTYHAQTNYIYNSSSSTEQWYFFGAAIDHYSDPGINLHYARKDIRDLSDSLKSYAKNVIIDTLMDEKATGSNLLSWKNNLSRASVNDIVILSLSGHGFLDAKKDFHFAAPTSTFDSFQTGISYDSLVGILDASPARRKILFLDACHSGLLDSDSVSYQLAEGVTVKSLGKKKNKEGISSSVSFRLMQEEFLDLSKHNGTIVIAAAAGSEFAMESGVRKNGLFTYVLLKGLFEFRADRDHDGRITTSELQHYLGREVEILSRGGQKPSARQENQGIDWTILEYEKRTECR